MKNTLLDKDYENAYNRKKKNSEERGVGFEFSLEEYTAIMKARSSFKCGYTGRDMVVDKGFNHKDYPEMDRVDENKGYSRNNILFCCSSVHKLKTEYIELGKSRKGLSHKELCILRSIDKVLKQPEVLAARQQPYHDVFNKALARKAELQAKEEQAIKKLEEQERNAQLETIQAKLKEQQIMSQHYLDITKTLSKMGLVSNMTFKQFRDKFRVKNDQLTGKPFNSYDEKFLWIPNKKDVMLKKTVEAKDFVVVHIETQKLVDNVLNHGNMKTIMKNTLKHL